MVNLKQSSLKCGKTEAGSPTPALMFQGASSSAGKSFLCAGLCRVLARKGYSVAPFKAQNMSLNSFVTMTGQEMSRAQSLQALACGLEPDARMNPVLLKPLGKQGSQIILKGEVLGTMSYNQYLKIKKDIWNSVRESYASLASEHDFIILEGAGSPAEINLRRHDIVNMAMAHEADAKVLLVADIDRGGAFAALAGTMLLLDKADRKRVHGFILNKFRGDASLLMEALDITSKKTGRPFMGVLPMLENLRLSEEDSMGLKELAATPGRLDADKFLDIALIDLPHISNFTDCDALLAEKDVRLRLARRGSDLGRPDLLILPGTRNTANDLAFLRESGLFEAIIHYAARIVRERRGGIVGLCGGLQMLGEVIADPDNVETGEVAQGLGLLDLRTTLRPPKILGRAEAIAELEGASLPVHGYEIHHGRSEGGNAVIKTASGNALGWGAGKGGIERIWGTYLHGVFDADGFRHIFLDRLRQEAGLARLDPVAYDPLNQLDLLADALEEHLEMPSIMALLGI